MDRLLALITLHEGNKLMPYLDTEGKVTIGRGRCLATNPLRPHEIAHLGRRDLTGGVTEEESIWLCVFGNGGIDQIVRDLAATYPWFKNLDEVRRAVLVDLSYNMGLGGLAKWVNTLHAFQYGQWEAAAKHLFDSKWAHQVDDGEGGRRGRADRLAEMTRTGQWPADLPA